MADRRSDCGVQPGDRLPAATLPAAVDGGSVRLREPAAGSAVILVLPDPVDRWLPYARALAADSSAYRDWAGRPLVVVPDGAGNAAAGIAGPPAAADSGAGAARVDARREPAPSGEEPPRVSRARVARDPGGALRARLGVPPRLAAVIVADRWGQVYHVACADEPDALPQAAAVEEWLRYLATQCPECGVPDEPGHGEWRQ